MMIVRILSFTTVIVDACMHTHTQSETRTDPHRISQHDLIKGSHHHWRKKLCACRENDTTVGNEDTAVTSSMRRCEMRKGLKEQKEEYQGRTGGID